MRNPIVISAASRPQAAPACWSSRPTVAGRANVGLLGFLEIADLRRSRVYTDPADHSTYDPPSEESRITSALPIGTQARLIAAAGVAASAGFPLNTLLTLRWTSLFGDGAGHWMQPLTIPTRIARLVERMRKWWGGRDIPAIYIWSRESVREEDEHWHLAFHLPPHHRDCFARYVAELTGEPTASGGQKTDGEFARGTCGSWHLARDTHPERAGHFLAAYIGKGEPSQQLFRGKLRYNERKPVRGHIFGGDQPDGRYDADQGVVLGTKHRDARVHISRALNALGRKHQA